MYGITLRPVVGEKWRIVQYIVVQWLWYSTVQLSGDVSNIMLHCSVLIIVKYGIVMIVHSRLINIIKLTIINTLHWFP